MSQLLASSLRPTSSKVKNFPSLLVPGKKKRRRRRGRRSLANILKKPKLKSEGSNRLRKVMKCSTNDSFISHTESSLYIT